MTKEQEKWKKHVEAWQQSGQTSAAYAVAQGLSPSTFGKNRRRLHHFSGTSDERNAGVVVRKVGHVSNGRVVQQTAEKPVGTIRIHWPALGVAVECGGGIDERTLQTVVQAVAALGHTL